MKVRIRTGLGQCYLCKAKGIGVVPICTTLCDHTKEQYEEVKV
jgi:hypothetical protein